MDIRKTNIRFLFRDGVDRFGKKKSKAMKAIGEALRSASAMILGASALSLMAAPPTQSRN